MELNNNAWPQRTIKCYIDYRIKKQKEKSENGRTFKIYSPNYFTLKPTEHLLINAKIDFELPDGLGALLLYFRYEQMD